MDSSIVVAERSKAYKHQSLTLLKNHFNGISVAAIRATLKQHEFNFTRAYHSLELLKTTNNISPSHPFLASTKTNFIQRPRPVVQIPRSTDRDLIAEIEAIDELNVKENRPVAKTIDLTADDEEDDKKAPASVEALIECECCFGDYPFDEMCSCDEGEHLFCCDCVRSYVREQVFGNDNSKLNCMSAEGCQAGISILFIEKAITDPKEQERVHEHMFHSNINSASMNDLWYVQLA